MGPLRRAFDGKTALPQRGNGVGRRGGAGDRCAAVFSANPYAGACVVGAALCATGCTPHTVLARWGGALRDGLYSVYGACVVGVVLCATGCTPHMALARWG